MSENKIWLQKDKPGMILSINPIIFIRRLLICSYFVCQTDGFLNNEKEKKGKKKMKTAIATHYLDKSNSHKFGTNSHQNNISSSITFIPNNTNQRRRRRCKTTLLHQNLLLVCYNSTQNQSSRWSVISFASSFSPSQTQVIVHEKVDMKPMNFLMDQGEKIQQKVTVL